MFPAQNFSFLVSIVTPLFLVLNRNVVLSWASARPGLRVPTCSGGNAHITGPLKQPSEIGDWLGLLPCSFVWFMLFWRPNPDEGCVPVLIFFQHISSKMISYDNHAHLRIGHYRHPFDVFRSLALHVVMTSRGGYSCSIVTLLVFDIARVYSWFCVKRYF